MGKINTMIQKTTGKAKDLLANVKFQAHKHSPEICVGLGILGVVTSSVLACRATVKATKVVDETKDQIDTADTAKEAGITQTGETYEEADYKADLRMIYIQTGVKMVKLYSVPVLLGLTSLGSIITSNRILQRRNMELTAAYMTLEQCFNAYRSNAIERFGEDVDAELRYGAKKQKVELLEKDPETGEEKKVKKDQLVAQALNASGYARFYGPRTMDDFGNEVDNLQWKTDNNYNLCELRNIQRYLNSQLVSKHYLFLNDAYEALGMPRTKEGQIIGWLYDPSKKYQCHNYVDLGVSDESKIVYSYDYEGWRKGLPPAIMVDFNVDGNVLEKMETR